MESIPIHMFVSCFCQCSTNRKLFAKTLGSDYCDVYQGIIEATIRDLKENPPPSRQQQIVLIPMLFAVLLLVAVVPLHSTVLVLVVSS